MRRLLAAALVLCLSLLATGCSGGSSSDSSSEPASSSDDGFLIEKVGEEVSVQDSSGEAQIRFVVSDIQVDFTCTSSISDPSKNGHYIAISMEIWSTAEVGPGSDVQYINPRDWVVLGPDGTEEEDSAGNAFSCAATDTTLPYQVLGEEHVKGVVVLDSKYTSGKLRLPLDWTGVGWQYAF